ncbi:MAG: hypothetical protein GF346_09985 [Candidatus Eisenbacteria bacterium]|nr:hypothetical protein [Candidatus Latescibacterota bacterium]MBD3302764.1 hypothetical protein [Candidatus Eisenbacteria bacterium]
MRRSLALRILLPALLAASIGCEEDTGVLPANEPPRTYLNVIGASIDTTDYRKVLHWWGTDRDGSVAGYLIRWSGGWVPPEGTEETYRGELYALTTATSDTFAVPLGGAYAVREFTVRAVDDRDLVDPTGVTQSFPLSNNPPTLAWNPAIPRPSTSLPAQAFGWTPTDVDGRETVNRFRIWLDGDSADARVVADTILALRPEDFGDGVDTERTLFVQAIDDADATSNVISHTWTVESPRGDWLWIDQITGPGSSRWDREIFEAILDSVTAGSLHRLDLAEGPDFVTSVEIEPLFSLFEGVVWLTGPYREDNDPKMARNLQTAETGIRAYVEGGGRILLAGQSLFGFRGGLSEAFTGEVLGIPDYFEIRIEPEGTRVTDLPLNDGEWVYLEREGIPDSLFVYGTSLNVDYFPEPAPPAIGRYWVPPGALERMSGSAPIPPQDQIRAYLGLVTDFGAGRIGIVTSSFARNFPRPSTDPNWEATLREGVRLFEEVLLP